MKDKELNLAHELEELFDIKHARNRDEKKLNQDAMDAQRDIRLLTHMFKDDVPDISIPINAHESIRWDASSKNLLFLDQGTSQILLGASRQTMIRVRPHLAQLVKQAKEFYRD